MNCRDLEELLSAYADGELPRTQREFIEEHLAVCADCRGTLADYIQAGRKLSSLRGLPESPDIRRDTIARVKASGTVPEKMRIQWLHAVAAVTAVFIIVALLIGADFWSAGSPEGPGVMAPPPLSEYIRGYTYTLGLVAGFLMIVGLVFRIKLTRKITGLMSIIFGGIGVYLGLDALMSVSKSDQSLIMGIFPLLGIIAGTVYIKKQAGRRWLADTSMFLSLVALVLYIAFLAGYHHWFSWLLIVTAVAIPVGILGCAFRNEFIKLRGIRWRPLLVAIPVAIVLIAVVVAPSLLMKSPEAMAASIVRNSPEVQAVFNGEDIKEVEVTTKIIGNEGDVLVVLVKTETRQAAAEVDLKREIVTDIVRVHVPELADMDSQKAADIARADPGVQELLAEGGIIGTPLLAHSVSISEVAGPDGEVVKEGKVEIIGQVPIESGGRQWFATVDIDGGSVIGLARQSTATLAADWSQATYTILNPVMLLLAVLILIGLIIRNKLAGTVAAVFIIVLGVLTIYRGLYAWPIGYFNQVLALMVPALGLAVGITDIRRRTAKKWIPAIGIALCLLALAWDSFNIIIVPDAAPGMIAAVSVIAAGIIIYALKDRIAAIKVPAKWLRPAIIGFAAVAVLVLALVQPWSGSLEPQKVLAKTYTATEKLQSYRMTYSGTTSVDGNTSSHHMEVMFDAPDRYHIHIISDAKTDEFIIIGENQYVTNNASRISIIASYNSFSSVLSKQATLDLLDELTDLQILPEEKIEGIRCLHYLGKLDMEKRIEETKRNLQAYNTESDKPAMTDEAMEEMFGQIRSIDVTHEIWIGKDDYLIRQIKTEQRGPADKNGLIFVDMAMKYFDINQPVIIEPPVDADGNLLDGWQLAGSIGSYEKVFGRSITTSIGSQEGYDDSVHQEVDYTITITNNSIETVRNVRVTIGTKLLEGENRPMVVAGPKTPADVMAPGESRTFHAHIPFDASGYTKEQIMELRFMDDITIHFETEAGVQMTESFESPPYPSAVPTAAEPGE